MQLIAETDPIRSYSSTEAERKTQYIARELQMMKASCATRFSLCNTTQERAKSTRLLCSYAQAAQCCCCIK